MDPKTVVHDISSDEEGGGSDDFDWISELLDKVDKDVDESDDVVEVSEVVLNPKKRLKSTNTVVKSSSLRELDDDDDDCVVLDGDPDKPVAVDDKTAGDSDELCIVGEKGQIACRDYPHSRHLCAKFPFNSTSHESYCSLCHCYVCDSHAPCVHWGTGISSIDHCHATEKEEFWKLQRKNFKQVDKSPLPLPRVPEIFPLPQVSRPTTVRACSTSTNPRVSNLVNSGRNQMPGYVLPRKKFQPHLVSHHLLSSRSHIVRKDQRHSVGNLGSQFLSPDMIFKRAGSVGAGLAVNQYGYNNHGSQYSRNLSSVPLVNDINPIGQQDLYTGISTDSAIYPNYSQQNTGSVFENLLDPQVLSQQNTGSIFVNTVPQPNVGPVFVNPVPPQPEASPHQEMASGVHLDSVPLQHETPSQQPNMRIIFSNPVPPQPQQSFHPNAPQVYSPSIPETNNIQDGFQQGNQPQQDQSFSNYDSSWADLAIQSNQQVLAAESHQIQSAGPTFGSPLVTEFDPQFSGNSNTASLDFQFENWLLENQSVSEALEVSVPPAFNVLSPEPAIIDGGIFFDF